MHQSSAHFVSQGTIVAQASHDTGPSSIPGIWKLRRVLARHQGSRGSATQALEPLITTSSRLGSPGGRAYRGSFSVATHWVHARGYQRKSLSHLALSWSLGVFQRPCWRDKGLPRLILECRLCRCFRHAADRQTSNYHPEDARWTWSQHQPKRHTTTVSRLLHSMARTS